jgi:hypothetical protein
MHASKGGGWAHFVIDQGRESQSFSVVFMGADGRCWIAPNPDVRLYVDGPAMSGAATALSQPAHGVRLQWQ